VADRHHNRPTSEWARVGTGSVRNYVGHGVATEAAGRLTRWRHGEFRNRQPITAGVAATGQSGLRCSITPPRVRKIGRRQQHSLPAFQESG